MEEIQEVAAAEPAQPKALELVPFYHGVPVIMPPHRETDLYIEGGNYLHAHVDFRYWDRPVEFGRAEMIKPGELPVYRKMARLREQPAIMPGALFMIQLIRKYEGCSLLRGNKCPHKYARVERNSDGVLQCPNHGMYFNDDGSPMYKMADLKLRVGPNYAVPDYPSVNIPIVASSLVDKCELVAGERVVAESPMRTVHIIPGDTIRIYGRSSYEPDGRPGQIVNSNASGDRKRNP